MKTWPVVSEKCRACINILDDMNKSGESRGWPDSIDFGILLEEHTSLRDDSNPEMNDIKKYFREFERAWSWIDQLKSDTDADTFSPVEELLELAKTIQLYSVSALMAACLMHNLEMYEANENLYIKFPIPVCGD